MAGNFTSLLVGLVYDGIDFVGGESRRTNQLAITGEVKVIGRIQLYQVSIMCDLIPYGFTGCPRRVGHLHSGGQWNLGGKSAHSEPTRGLNSPGRYLHARTGHDPSINPFAQV